MIKVAAHRCKVTYPSFAGNLLLSGWIVPRAGWVPPTQPIYTPSPPSAGDNPPTAPTSHPPGRLPIEYPVQAHHLPHLPRLKGNPAPHSTTRHVCHRSP